VPLKPPSTRAIFADAPVFFERDIAPLVNDAERRRRSALREAAGIALVCAVLIVFLLTVPGDTGAVLSMIIAVFGFAIAGARINAVRARMTERWIGRTVAHLGFTYQRERSRPDYAEPFMRFGLVRSFNREQWEDEIVGDHDGVSFSLVEAHLKKRTGGKRKRTRTIFHGQMIAIDIPWKFDGVTIIKRDAGVMNALGKPGKQFQRVGLASSKFEKAFEAWSTDQVEARVLLDPIMLERFEELERLFGGAKLRAAFEAGKLYIVLEVGDRLNVGSMFRPIDGAARIERLLKEFDIIFDLIDVAARKTTTAVKGPLSVADVRAG